MAGPANCADNAALDPAARLNAALVNAVDAHTLRAAHEPGPRRESSPPPLPGRG